MKIREVLELTHTKKIADIAKEHLDIGEKKAVAALKEAGCYSISGKRGWYYDGNPAVLEKSIYDFSAPSKISRKATANVSTNEKKETKFNNNQRSKVSVNVSEEEIEQGKEQVAPSIETITSSERTNVVRKRSSFDLDVQLLKELKIQAIIHDRNVYEMVESAIKLYLNELKK